MQLKELLNKHIGDGDTVNKIVEEMKQNKIYLSKEENLDIRYDKLKTDYDAKLEEFDALNSRLKELSESNQDTETLKNKTAEYESIVNNLKRENEEIKINAALKHALINAKVTNLDYITYKINQSLKSSNKSLELDENGQLKNIDEIIEIQKTTEPNFFEKQSVHKEVDIKTLGRSTEEREPEPKSLLDALEQRYTQTNT